MSEQLVVLEDCGNYACITLNRPDQKNVLNRAALLQLQDILRQCVGRYASVILTGAGSDFCAGTDVEEQSGQNARGKAFCAGVDLRERNEWVRKGAKIRGDNVRNKWYDTMGTIIRNHPAIFIAAVNGLALGGGATLVNVCDLAIMAEEAEIGIPRISWGIYPGTAGASTQVRVLRKHAAWPILTGRSISAAAAVEIGMVNLAVPAGKLLDEAKALAAHIAKFDPIALDWCKKALDQIPSQVADWSVALEYGRGVASIIREQTGRGREA